MGSSRSNEAQTARGVCGQIPPAKGESVAQTAFRLDRYRIAIRNLHHFWRASRPSSPPKHGASARAIALARSRAGGEHLKCLNQTCRGSGSSPRWRGTPAQLVEGRRPRRFIPARAGNTPGRGVASVSPTVHPRAGGEHPYLVWHGQEVDGSSPRGRGTQENETRPIVVRRFIPARAGNTGSAGPRHRLDTVHPRAGGEHTSALRPHGRDTGSSPRGRGTLFSQPDDSGRLFECQRAYQL